MKHKRKVLHIGFAALALALLLMASLPSQALAQADSTTVGTLSLTPAFENIGVISNFAGDDNGDNNAILEYREVGSSTWKPGIPMTVDRRDELWLYDDDTRGTVYVPNSWKNQWRAIIFGLEPNTEYEVRVTYTDPDGVSGSPVIGAVRTRNDNPPSNGNTYYVSTTGSDSNPGTFDEPLATIQHAADIVNPGDTVLIMPGTYTEDGPRGYGITIARSGEEDNYITFQSYDMENMAIIDAEYIWRKGCLSVLGPSYIRIKGLTMRYSGGDAAIIEIETASDRTPENIIVEDCHLYDPGEQYANSGVLIRQAKNILVQRNLITMSGVGRTQQFGVFFWGFLGGGVIRDNTIIGPFKDGIGGSGNHHIDGGAVRDSYVYNNYIQDTWDDGIEMEGGNINIAIWNNIIKPRQTNYGRMGLGLAPVIIGPTYAFRNVLINCRDAAIKIGASSSGNMYLYHNTMYTTHHAAHGVWHVGDNAIAENVTSRNNIIRLIHGRLIRNQDTSGDKGLNSYDYDNMWTDRVASGFGLNWYYVVYDSLPDFQAIGQELHGISDGDNLFVNPDNDDFGLQAGSPNIDNGVILPGLNDAGSPWPYSGSAPDIGAFEYDSGPSIDTTPPYTTGHNPPKGATGVAADTNITIHVKDDGAGVEQDSIVMTVEGETVTPSISGTPNDYTLTYDPPSDFEYSQVVDITIDATDLASSPNVMSQDAYSFTIATGPAENQPPVADAGPDQSTLVGDTVTFDGSASSDLDGTIISYDWDFGDEASGTGITTTHAYSTADIYTVTLTVTDNEGATDTDTCIVTVNSPGDNNTTVGALELKSTFHCISVYSNFASDDNGDNQATLEYREVGGSWLPGIEMTVDRRDTVISGGLTVSNPYSNQWRASIFGLQPNTEYEVRVTYTDPDGVTGSPVTATIQTRNDNPPSTGNIYYVATTGSDSNPGTEALPFRTIQKAADTVQAGDKVLIKAGTYNEKVTILASGTSDNYITFMPYGDGDVVIDGEGTQEYGITVGVSGIEGTGNGTQQGGNYVRISGLEVVNSRYAGINVGGDNVIIENCEITDFNVADDQNADHRTSGITVNNWGASNLVVRGNLITRNIGASGFNAPMGIHIRNKHSDQGGGHIIYNNQIIASGGNIKDGIGGLPNFGYTGSLYRDSDIYDNYIANCYDDGIEPEGGNMNVRIWNNTIEDCRTMGLAFASTIIGPLYVFRNVMTGFTDAAFKLGGDSYGVAYIYHNTAYGSSSSSNGITNYGGSGLDNMVFRNNIIHIGRYVIECENNSYDYDNLFTTDLNRFAKLNGITYTSLSALQSATGQELNGISANSQFVDPANDDLNLQSTSPCIDEGLILPGFNDADSPWPYSGSAPDMGAFESDSGPAIDTTPPYTIGHNPPKEATGVAPDTNIMVHVKDDGTGVEQDSIVMTIESETVTPSISGTPSDYTLTYDPPSDFEHSQVVDVTIDARDLASPPNVMPQDAYSFTIAATPKALMEGDGSLNERVQISDAMLIAQYAVGLETLTDDQLTCADTTDDDNATIADAMHIAQWLVDPDGTLGVLNKPLWETPADDDMLHPAP